MSELADAFGVVWSNVAKIPLVAEHVWHNVREWRFDYAHPESLVAIEIEGGIFGKGGHSSVSGLLRDIEKYNAATMFGWSIIRIHARDIRDRPVVVVEDVERLIVGRLALFREHQLADKLREIGRGIQDRAIPGQSSMAGGKVIRHRSQRKRNPVQRKHKK